MSAGRLAARVRLGIALQDLTVGEHWVWAVELDLLDMASCSACVIGQTHGDYEIGVEALGLDFRATLAHGFNANEDRLEDFVVLNRLWAYAIRRLREQRTAPRVSAVAS